MYYNISNVASVDTQQYISELCEMIRIRVRKGYEPYIMTFMFKHLPSNDHAAKSVMNAEISRVFRRFRTEVHRNPKSAFHRRQPLILLSCPDWPTLKSKKRQSLPSVQTSEIHSAGMLLIPPGNRLKCGIKEHFRIMAASYIRPNKPLARVHLKHVDTAPAYASDYTFKSVKSGRCSIDDLTIFLSTQH